MRTLLGQAISIRGLIVIKENKDTEITLWIMCGRDTKTGCIDKMDFIRTKQ